jgi:methylmalonyl-CoA/ethylmalonyl-CoA epimerase
VTNDELRELNSARTIYQIAFVTRDLERSMKAWVEQLGIGPWTVLTFTEETVRNFHVDGQPVTEPFKFLIGISWVGDMQLEIIEPVHGNLSYWRHLEAKGEGLHHIKERIPDEQLPEVIEQYRAKGIGVMQTGQFDIDVHYNLDTEGKLDFVLELGNCPLLDLPEDMVSVYPPEVVDKEVERV